jgi:acetyltransferase-like isoleucine patch superfamily enzyme
MLFIPYYRLSLKLMGVQYGKNFLIINRAKFILEKNSQLIIGDNFQLQSGDYYNPLSRNIRGCIAVYPGGKVLIGNNVGMSAPCIFAHQLIVIEDNVKIGAGSTLLDSDAHSTNFMERRPGGNDTKNKVNKAITVEQDVLIGMNCIILKGVTIGARSIIGAGSVVTKNIPPDSIAAGNPCKLIRTITNKEDHAGLKDEK